MKDTILYDTDGNDFYKIIKEGINRNQTNLGKPVFSFLKIIAKGEKTK